jgi:deazaflavin-dependent oxidoreductase (nitroreductase family)
MEVSLMWVVLLIPLLIVVALVAVPIVLPKSVFYSSGRPTRAGRVANRLSEWYAAAGGPPSWQISLETLGRKSGRTFRTVLGVARHDGADYLVSMLGEKSAWVHNVRAAGGDAVIRHGGRRRVRLEEIPPSTRAPVLKAYCARARSGRRHFEPLTPQSSVDEFATVADRYPVFRIVEMDDKR